MEENNQDINLAKVIFLGDNNVGKSSILASILNWKTSLPKKTIISRIFNKNDGSGEKVKINFYDTIKDENYDNINPIYYRYAQIAIIVFDVTKRSSFEILSEIMKKIKENAHSSIILILVGNKIDLEINSTRSTTKEEAEKYTKNIGAFYIEVSSLTREGIDDLVNLMINKIPKPDPNNQVVILQAIQPLQNNFCSRITCGAR